MVLCDVSESVASFAHFTLLLVYALREQFSQVRAFAFIDELDEVTRFFTPGARRARGGDPADRTRPTSPGWSAAPTTAAPSSCSRERYPDAIGPRTSLLILGDARSNYGDLALPTLAELAARARTPTGSTPSAARHWDTGDSRGERLRRESCRWSSAATSPS